MQHFLSLLDHPKLFWLLESIDSFLVRTQGNGGVWGPVWEIGDLHSSVISSHKLPWHGLREITSRPRPWRPFHKIRGFRFVSLLRLLGPTISNSSSTLYFMEERLIWPPKGWLMVTREGPYKSMESIRSALCSGFQHYGPTRFEWRFSRGSFSVFTLPVGMEP